MKTLQSHPWSFQRWFSNVIQTSTTATTTTTTSITITTTASAWVSLTLRRPIPSRWRSRRCRMRQVTWWPRIVRTQQPGGYQRSLLILMKSTQMSVDFSFISSSTASTTNSERNGNSKPPYSYVALIGIIYPYFPSLTDVTNYEAINSR